MKHIIKEGFDFNNAIDNDTSDIIYNDITNDIINDIFLNNINTIKNIIAKNLPFTTYTIDYDDMDYFSIMIKYKSEDLPYLFIEFKYIDKKYYPTIKFNLTKNSDVFTGCIISILNSLKNYGFIISDFITYNKTSFDKKDFYYNIYTLDSQDLKRIFLFLENNYKIKLVEENPLVSYNKRYSELIKELKINIFYSDKNKKDLLLSNITNITKDTKYSIYYSKQ